MTEMIERVAMALAAREGVGDWKGGLLGERGRDMWRATARAAIEAMRYPTDGMTKMGDKLLASNVKPMHSPARDTWTLMAAYAIDEPKAPSP